MTNNQTGARKFEETFKVNLSQFAAGRDTPVDMYMIEKDGRPKILLRQAQTFSEEVEALCYGSGIIEVNIPVSQKSEFDNYISELAEERDGKTDKGYSGEFLDPEKVRQHYDFMENYIPLNVCAMLGETRPDFTIYVRKSGELKIALEKNSLLRQNKLDEWKKNNVNSLIHKSDKEAYRNYLQKYTKSSGDAVARMAFIREDAKIIVEGLAENPRSERLLQDSKEAVANLTSAILDSPNSFYGLMKINNYDYYTFTHSVHVATLSIALALCAGLTEKDGLADLGLGALLHDIGKTKVDNNLINKPGKLTDNEFKIVTNHVTLGYEMLKDNKSIPRRALVPLLQHHEKLSGEGYPNKLSGDAIEPIGRITSIIDMYDALTTRRPYKKAFSPFDALALISKNKKDYDVRFFGFLVKLIHRQEI